MITYRLHTAVGSGMVGYRLHSAVDSGVVGYGLDTGVFSGMHPLQSQRRSYTRAL
jgi:hypothetical protein